MLSFTAQIEQERAKLEQRDADPLREKVAAITRGIEAISTVALLDLIGLPNTTGNGRRVAKPCARWDISRSRAAGSCPAAGTTPCAAAGRVPYVGLSTVKMFPRWDR